MEVSDVVVNKAGEFTVGFKFRMKPNGLGELFDFNSAIHKSLPPGIQQNFKYDLLDRDLREENPLHGERAGQRRFDARSR